MMDEYALIIDHEEIVRDDTYKPLIDALTYHAQSGPFDEAVIRKVRPGYVPDCGHRCYGMHDKTACAEMVCRNYVGKKTVARRS